MPDARKRPCSICRHWFRPDARVGARQRVCRNPECQAARRKRTAARWRAANRGYATAYRIQLRNAHKPPPEPLRVPAPLNRLPWDLAKDEFGGKGADFIGVVSTLLLHTAKDQFRVEMIDATRVAGTLRPPVGKEQMPPSPY